MKCVLRYPQEHTFVFPMLQHGRIESQLHSCLALRVMPIFLRGEEASILNIPEGKPFRLHPNYPSRSADYAGLQVGKVECNVCHESYSTSIHKLTEAIDVYSDWIDACEEANNRE